ncbi:MAG: LPS export ABC transporter permease LptG [Deltaproteobacteria bacterium]|nr:LPS export ABC transporter permease LptG [Deltaproteobacteria bacterium]
MKTLDLHIGGEFTRYFLLVLFILGSLFSLFEFFGQLDDVGKGSYQLKDAFLLVLFTLPGRILDLIPVSTLLGSIIALGLLADNNELLAMQASGISVKRICWSVIAAAALPMLAAGLLAEFIVPPLEQQAHRRRLAAMGDADITFTKSGFWARKGPFFIHVRKIHPGGIPGDVDIFEWDPDGRLRVFTHARKADITEEKQWVLTDIEQKTVTDRGITTRSLDTLSLESFLSAKQMAIQKLPPESLSPSALYQYTRILQARGQNADQYKMVFWQKVSTPLTTVAMVLLSLSFVFGPTRGMTAGHRIMMGSTVGIVLYFLNQILGHFGLILGVNPALTTVTPLAVILSLALWLLSRGP